MNKKRTYAMNPKRFVNVGYIGNMGSDWVNTDYHLSMLITQNILYAAYHEARSISEIADLVGVQNSLVEEEVYFLEENGFMDKVADDKYSTIMLLHDLSKDVYEERHKIFSKYAEIVCEKYIPLLLEWITVGDEFIRPAFSIFHSPFSIHKREAGGGLSMPALSTLHPSLSTKIYTPQKDPNFLLWSLITIVFCSKLNTLNTEKELTKHSIKRNDGGDFVAVASLENDFVLSYDKEIYKTFEDKMMYFDAENFYVKQYDTYYDDRTIEWNRVLQKEYSSLYRYIKGEINYHPETTEFFDEMYRKGLLTCQAPHHINIIVSAMPLSELVDILPPLPNNFIDLKDELAHEIFNISKNQYPPHVQEMFHAFCQHSFSSADMIIRILEFLLLNGTLKPLTDFQKKTVNTIMFCDVLPS